MKKEDLKADMILAMKAKDSTKKLVLQSLIADIDNREKNPKDDDNPIVVIASMLKKLNITLGIEKDNGLDTSKTEREIEILTEYLPTQLTVDEITVRVRALIDGLPSDQPINKGRLTGMAVKDMKGVAKPQDIISVISNLL